MCVCVMKLDSISRVPRVLYSYIARSYVYLALDIPREHVIFDNHSSRGLITQWDTTDPTQSMYSFIIKIYFRHLPLNCLVRGNLI